MKNYSLLKTNSKIILAFFVSITFFTAAQAKIRDFETSRLKSTAGAGVASLLLDESSILNPASIAFFNVGAFYFQKSSSEAIADKDAPAYEVPENSSTAFIASDSKSGVNGSLSFIKQKQGAENREQISASFARRVSKKSSMGIIIRSTKENILKNNSLEKMSYKQTTLGFTHALSPAFTIGLVFIDPFKANAEDQKGIIGFQYVYDDMIAIMLDTSANYSTDLAESFAYSTAVQVKILNDFYMRAGMFDDKNKSERGNGVGIGWVQPKLSLNLAMKNIKIAKNTSKDIKKEKLKETSFSVSYKF